MTISDLRDELQRLQIPEPAYSLYGAHHDDAVVLAQLPAGRWRVFYSERGGEFDVAIHDSEDAACRDLLARLSREFKR